MVTNEKLTTVILDEAERELLASLLNEHMRQNGPSTIGLRLEWALAKEVEA